MRNMVSLTIGVKSFHVFMRKRNQLDIKQAIIEENIMDVGPPQKP